MASSSPLSDEELDHTPLNKGKYQGQTPSQVAEHDPGYIVWASENWDHKICSDVLARTCLDEE
jgi:uncharacterized protein CbrC (UPF0167 family)